MPLIVPDNVHNRLDLIIQFEILIYTIKNITTMKLKDIMNIDNPPKPILYRKYEDFVESEMPENSIELDSQGHIISDQISVLNFIQFLLNELEYLPEMKNTNISEKEKNKYLKKKKRKKRKKHIKNINQFGNKNYPSNNNSIDYQNPINIKDFDTKGYYNQPFSSSSSSSLENIPNVSDNDSSIS